MAKFVTVTMWHKPGDLGREYPSDDRKVMLNGDDIEAAYASGNQPYATRVVFKDARRKSLDITETLRQLTNALNG